MFHIQLSYYFNKVKVKVTLNRPTKAQRGSRGTALLFLYLGARRG
jgi:hypothetical protein